MTRPTASDILAPLIGVPPLSFECERLRLRAVQAQDAKLLFDLYASDPIATKYMSFRCTGRLEDTAAFMEQSAKLFLEEPSTITHFTWVIELKKGGIAVGAAGFGPKNKFTLHGGYILGRQYWGKGYATEAWKCLVDWAKTQPGVIRIEAVHDTDNRASGRVLEKSGLSFEGILRRYSVHPNVSELPRDVAMYAWTRRG